ncbi:hypothetical protein IKF15_02625 [Candidatus Saccharibacteria bacterium]|nr:hypothetical protein [Candidatus Saccharibacteria bacterium]
MTKRINGVEVSDEVFEQQANRFCDGGRIFDSEEELREHKARLKEKRRKAWGKEFFELTYGEGSYDAN